MHRLPANPKLSFATPLAAAPVAASIPSTIGATSPHDGLVSFRVGPELHRRVRRQRADLRRARGSRAHGPDRRGERIRRHHRHHAVWEHRNGHRLSQRPRGSAMVVVPELPTGWAGEWRLRPRRHKPRRQLRLRLSYHRQWVLPDLLLHLGAPFATASGAAAASRAVPSRRLHAVRQHDGRGGALRGAAGREPVRRHRRRPHGGHAPQPPPVRDDAELPSGDTNLYVVTRHHGPGLQQRVRGKRKHVCRWSNDGKFGRLPHRNRREFVASHHMRTRMGGG